MIRISPLLLLILVSFTDHVGSVVLTSVPLTAIDGELFTLICSSNTSGESARGWYRSGELVFQTTKGSSSPTVSTPNVFNMYLSGRINVSCDIFQHNVTLRINSAIDNRSWWTCFDNTNSQRSNTMTINAVVKSRLSPTTTTVLFTTTTPLFGTEKETSTAASPSPPTTEDNINTPNIYDSASHYEDMDHQYGSVEKQYVNTVEDTATDTPDYVNTDEDKRDTAYYNIGHDTNLP